MAKQKYAVQIWGNNSPFGQPHWMTYYRTPSKENAEAEKRFLQRQGIKDHEIRVIKI